jgi:hypothetical protein
LGFTGKEGLKSPSLSERQPSGGLRRRFAGEKRTRRWRVPLVQSTLA